MHLPFKCTFPSESGVEWFGQVVNVVCDCICTVMGMCKLAKGMVHVYVKLVPKVHVHVRVYRKVYVCKFVACIHVYESTNQYLRI